MCANAMAFHNTDTPASEYDSPISDFFRGKCVFLTGCTGFLGQLYLEKLLRLDAKTIYVLMRPKRTESCADRLEKILREPIFDELLQTIPNIRDRIRILNGALAAPNLDISDASALSDLIASTEIVVHSAANVSFVADVFQPIETNVYGTYELLELCKRMQHLSAFLYVSTAYSQLNHNEPVEQFYEPIVDPLLLIKSFQRFGANCTDQNEKNAFEANMFKLMADSKMIPYALTKNAAEVLVQSYGDCMPIAVIRPSIVICTLQDPIPGWVNGFQLSNLMTMAVVTGLARTIYYKNIQMNLVSGDMVINASLAVIWHTAVEYKRTRLLQPKVYHLTNQKKDNLAYVDQAAKYAVKDGQRYAGLNCVWYPTVTMTKCQWHYRLCRLFYEIIPGAILDCILPKKPVSCLKISRIIAAMPHLENTTREYRFGSREIVGVWCSMTETDRHSFNFDTTSVDWKTLISTSIWSVRTYNLKQTPEQLKAAEESFNYLKLLHFTFKFFICLIVPCTYWRIWGTNFLSLFIVGCLCYYFI